MAVFERGNIKINYQDVGTGFPLLIIPGGGLNSIISWVSKGAPFDATAEFKNEFRCITADLRNAPDGQSSGPVEVDRPWDSHTDDQLALMDHLGIKRLMVLGYCIGGPFIWNLLKRAPDRVVAGVLAQPSGFRADLPDHFYQTNIVKWGPQLCASRPDITMDMVDKYLRNMYLTNPDFVFSVDRNFVRNCQIPLLVLPDDTEAHVYAVAMEMVRLAPNAQVSLYPWKDTKENTALAVRHARSFLKANSPRA